jgi:hypothetical protein
VEQEALVNNAAKLAAPAPRRLLAEAAPIPQSVAFPFSAFPAILAFPAFPAFPFPASKSR